VSLESILATSRSRKLLTTSLSTREMREFPADVRARSLWVARANSVPYMEKFADVLDRFLSGAINQAAARNELQEELEALQYDPETGFAGEEDPEIPPAEKGSLRDISSARRINLKLETQEDLMYGRGRKIAGLQRIETWPAWELVRGRNSVEPRDWDARWAKAADSVGWNGVLKSKDAKPGRKIALKTSPIWKALGSSELFDDALDTDHEPFAFNSGMIREELRADETRTAGLPTKTKGQAKVVDALKSTPVNADLKVSTKKLPPDLVDSLKKDLAAELEGSELRYQQALDASREAYLRRSPAMQKRLGLNLNAVRQTVIRNRVQSALQAINSGRKSSRAITNKVPARLEVKAA